MPSGRRRRILLALAAASVVVGVPAAVGAYLLLKPPGNVSRPDVRFDDTEPEEPKSKRRRDRFVWPMYGYTKDHRRLFDPPRPVRGPWRIRWKRKAGALLEFPPVVARGATFQLVDNGVLVSRVKRTGRLRWRRKLGALAAASPAIDGAFLYVTILQNSANGSTGRVAALRLRDGRIRWSRRLPSRSESSPLVHRGKVYFGTEDGTVYCLRAASGRTLWTYRAAGAVKGSPTLADGLLYFGDYGGHVHAVRARDGRRIWSTDVARRALRSGTFYATAAVAYGRVYIGSTDGREYSLSARDGELAWAHQTGGYVYSSAAVKAVPGAGPTIFFGSYDGTFYALNARSGSERWKFRSGGKISGSPTIIGDVVYFADLGRSLTFGLRIRDGRVVFRREQGGYDPVISDGRNLLLTGRRSLTLLEPRRRARAGRDRERGRDRRRGARDGRRGSRRERRADGRRGKRRERRERRR